MLLVKYADYDQVWLVKSAGLVLGPFSLVELTQALKERRVALLDEVRTPATRWGFVRENSQLSELVRIIREAEARQSSKTGKTTVDVDDADSTQSISQTLKIIETTPTPAHSSSEDEMTRPMIVPTAPESKVPITPAMTTTKKAATVKSTAAAVPLPQIPASKIKKIPKTAIVAMSLVLVIGIFLMLDEKKAPQSSRSSVELFNLAKKTKTSGFYEKSLMMYERAIGSSIADSNTKFEMLPILLLDSKNYQKAQKTINELSADKSLNPEMSARLENWAGLLLMKQGQFLPAEDKLRAAAEKFSNYSAIQINRVTNFYFAGQFDSAIQLGQTLKSQGVNSPMISIAQGLSMLSQPNERFVVADAKKILNELNFWSNSRRDLAFESLLTEAALVDKIEGEVQTLPLIERLLEQSVAVTHNYIHELDFDSDLFAWTHLKPLCDSLSGKYSSHVNGVALGIACEIEEENLAQANTDVQAAILKYPGDQHMIGLNAAVLKIQGRPQEAKALLSQVRTRPGSLTHAQICLDEKDLPCAETILKFLFEKDANDPEVLYQLTQLNLLKNKRDMAEQLAEKGLKITRSYRPLLEIREEMGDL